MNFKDGLILDLGIEYVTVRTDDRGSLFELFRIDELGARNINVPEMAYASYTLPGVSRGPHEHAHQTDVFVFCSQTFQFFAWDNRHGSATYLNRSVIHVGEGRETRIIVPPGIVHAYRNISTGTGLVLNAPDKLYAGYNRLEPVDEIRHEKDQNNPFRLDMESYEISRTTTSPDRCS